MMVECAGQIEAIAYHGWGFGADFWAGWVAKFAALGGTLRCADRGYFGAPQSWEFDQAASCQPASYKILLTHSYGLHWCPVEQMAAADLIICLAGFEAFHPAEEPERRRSQRRVTRMIAKFATDPAAVLTEFWGNCDGVCDPRQSLVLIKQTGHSSIGICGTSIAASYPWRCDRAL
jgi:pimeloyl-[acyl-carrier protein] methyl ester esterase